MASLADNALIEVREYLELLGKPVDDPDTPETKIIVHVNAVSQLIEKYLGRVVCPEQSKDDFFRGDDTDTYYVKHRYIASGSPTLYYWDGDEWVEMTVANYPRQTDDSRGEIWFSNGHQFHRATRYKVTYTTGYSRASVPDDVKLACVRLVQQSIMRADGKEGLRSESLGDAQTTYSMATGYGKTPPGAIPLDIKALIYPYRSLTIG